MKKVIFAIFVLMAILLTSQMVAAKLVPVNYNISIDFDNTNNQKFILYAPQGYEHHFQWEDNDTHADKSYIHTMYYDFDEEELCPDNSQLEEYQKISTGLSNTLATCTIIMQGMNKSQEYLEKLDALRTEKGKFETDYNTCNTEKGIIKNDADQCDIDIDKSEEKVESLNTDLDRCQDQARDKQNCEVSLEDAIKDKSTFGIGGILAGLGIGYMLWKKKKAASGPSEQQEAGTTGDNVDFNQQTFTDGPKN